MFIGMFTGRETKEGWREWKEVVSGFSLVRSGSVRFGSVRFGSVQLSHFPS